MCRTSPADTEQVTGELQGDSTLVIVLGNSRSLGAWVVTPISMDPAHFVTILSSRTWGKERIRLIETSPTLPRILHLVELVGW